LYYFHKKDLKLKKTQKNIFSGFFMWLFLGFLGGFFIANPAFISLTTIVVDRHRVDADPDQTFHFDADPDPTLSFTQVGKSANFFLLLTAVPFLAFLSAS
jgi:hypothetical protein